MVECSAGGLVRLDVVEKPYCGTEEFRPGNRRSTPASKPIGTPRCNSPGRVNWSVARPCPFGYRAGQSAKTSLHTTPRSSPIAGEPFAAGIGRAECAFQACLDSYRTVLVGHWRWKQTGRVGNATLKVLSAPWIRVLDVEVQEIT
jgi:hypothetical protein